MDHIQNAKLRNERGTDPSAAFKIGILFEKTQRLKIIANEHATKLLGNNPKIKDPTITEGIELINQLQALVSLLALDYMEDTIKI